MRFVEHVRDAWGWLPAFRAVAETEHLPTAARELGLAPSSLSRSIRQLEACLGVELFDHRNKMLTLNAAGRELLDAVRASMRLVDDAVCRVRGSEMIGGVIAATSPELPRDLLARASVELCRMHAGLTITTCVASDHAIDGMIQRGAIDAAIVTRAPRDPSLDVTELVTWRRAVYVACGTEVTPELRFVALGSQHDPIADGWPVGVKRRVAMWTHDEQVALDICASGGLAAVLSERVAATAGDRVRPIPEHRIAEQKLFLTTRRALGEQHRTQALVDAIRATVARSAELA